MAKQLTVQQTFEKSAMHLLKQGKTAKGLVPGQPTKSCVNFDPVTGRRCAIACLVDKYRLMTNKAYWFGGPTAIKPLLDEVGLTIKSPQWNLALELMKVHDTSKPSRWPQKLRALARREKLTIPNWLRDA